MSDTPAVAVVVLNWNAWQDTVACLARVLGQDAPELRVIVVDNGSRDGSLRQVGAWLESAVPEVEVCNYGRTEAEAGGVAEAESRLSHGRPPRTVVLIANDANLGFAAGNNVGLRYALARSYELVLVLNNDAALPSDAVRRLAETLVAHRDWVGVAPKLVTAEEPRRVLYAGGALRLGRAQVVHLGRGRRDGPAFAGARETGHVTACCGLYRGAFLREAGLFDEAFFFGHEDGALSVVARRNGRRFGVLLDVAVAHREGASLSARPALSVYYFNKYRLVLVRRYGGLRQRIAAAAFLILTRLVKFPWLAARGRADLVIAEFRAYRDYHAGRLAAYDRDRAASRGAEDAPA